MATKINGVSPFCSRAETLLGKIDVFSFPPTKATQRGKFLILANFL